MRRSRACRRTCCRGVPYIVLTVRLSSAARGVRHGQGEVCLHSCKLATRAVILGMVRGSRALCRAVPVAWGRRQHDSLDICQCPWRSPSWYSPGPSDVVLWRSRWAGGGGGSALHVSPAHHAGADQGTASGRPFQHKAPGAGKETAVSWVPRSSRPGTQGAPTPQERPEAVSTPAEAAQAVQRFRAAQDVRQGDEAPAAFAVPQADVRPPSATIAPPPAPPVPAPARQAALPRRKTTLPTGQPSPRRQPLPWGAASNRATR